MKFFRQIHFQRILTVVTGIVFLNMSFFLAELSYFEIGKENEKMLENLVRLVAGVSEEEKDGAHTSSESSSMAKEVDLFIAHHPGDSHPGYTLVENNFHNIPANNPKSGMYETPLQPPEA